MWEIKGHGGTQAKTSTGGKNGKYPNTYSYSFNIRVVITGNSLSFLTCAKYKILYKYENPKMKFQTYPICKLCCSLQNQAYA